jgi:hypothetical protein
MWESIDPLPGRSGTDKNRALFAISTVVRLLLAFSIPILFVGHYYDTWYGVDYRHRVISTNCEL